MHHTAGITGSFAHLDFIFNIKCDCRNTFLQIISIMTFYSSKWNSTVSLGETRPSSSESMKIQERDTSFSPDSKTKPLLFVMHLQLNKNMTRTQSAGELSIRTKDKVSKEVFSSSDSLWEMFWSVFTHRCSITLIDHIQYAFTYHQNYIFSAYSWYNEFYCLWPTEVSNCACAFKHNDIRRKESVFEVHSHEDISYSEWCQALSDTGVCWYPSHFQLINRPLSFGGCDVLWKEPMIEQTKCFGRPENSSY